MNILLISAAYPRDPGGVATHVANLAHGLLKASDSNHVSVLTASKNTKTFPARKGRLTVWKMERKEIPNFSGRRTPLEDPLAFVLKEWDLINADIIHAHDFQSAYIGLMLKIAFKKPLFVTIHRSPSKWKKDAFKEHPKECFMEAIRIQRFTDQLIVPSNASLNVLLEQGFSKECVTVIPHGINYKYLSSFTNLPSVLDRLPLYNRYLVLCPIRADEHKDPDTVIRAAAYLKKSYPRQRFLFVLTDKPENLFSYLPQTAKKLGLEVGADIIFESFKYNEMPTLYRKAIACILPGIESFGQAALEAFVFKTPVIAANEGALAEIVVHNKNGLLFKHGSYEDLAYQVNRVFRNYELKHDLIKNGLQDVMEKYDALKMVKNYEGIYEMILAKLRREN